MSKDKKPCSSCSKNVGLETSSKGSVQDAIKKFKSKGQTAESSTSQLYTSNDDTYRGTQILKTQTINNDKKTITELTILNIISKLDKNTKKYKDFGAYTSSSSSTLSAKEIFEKFPAGAVEFINIPKEMITIGQLIYNSKNKNLTPKSKSADGCCRNGVCDSFNVSTDDYTETKDGITTKYYKCTCKNGRWENGKSTKCWKKTNGDCKNMDCKEYNPPSDPVTYVGTINNT
jgi:hypothetical protein